MDGQRRQDVESAAVRAVLVRVRARIADPARWTQGAWTRDATGKPQHWGSPDTVCWCLSGALCLEARDERTEVRWDAQARLDVAAGGPHVHFNDTHTHAEVLALVDRATEACG